MTESKPKVGDEFYFADICVDEDRFRRNLPVIFSRTEDLHGVDLGEISFETETVGDRTRHIATVKVVAVR